MLKRVISIFNSLFSEFDNYKAGTLLVTKKTVMYWLRNSVKQDMSFIESGQQVVVLEKIEENAHHHEYHIMSILHNNQAKYCIFYDKKELEEMFEFFPTIPQSTS